MTGSSRLVVFDLETTGLSPRSGHRVIEIGAVAVENGRLGAEFHSLISTDQPIHWAARKVHGISSRMLAGQPDAATVFSRFREFIASDPLVAHNAPFDLRFLASEFARLGLALPNPSFCTLRLSRSRYPQLSSHKLENLARYLLGAEALAGERLHRALADARLTAKIWLRMNRDCC